MRFIINNNKFVTENHSSNSMDCYLLHG